MTVKPRRYLHECDSCIFVGQYGRFDLYTCITNGEIKSMVARFADEPWDYVSGILIQTLDK